MASVEDVDWSEFGLFHKKVLRFLDPWTPKMAVATAGRRSNERHSLDATHKKEKKIGYTFLLQNWLQSADPKFYVELE